MIKRMSLMSSLLYAAVSVTGFVGMSTVYGAQEDGAVGVVVESVKSQREKSNAKKGNKGSGEGNKVNALAKTFSEAAGPKASSPRPPVNKKAEKLVVPEEVVERVKAEIVAPAVADSGDQKVEGEAEPSTVRVATSVLLGAYDVEDGECNEEDVKHAQDDRVIAQATVAIAAQKSLGAEHSSAQGNLPERRSPITGKIWSEAALEMTKNMRQGTDNLFGDAREELAKRDELLRQTQEMQAKLAELTAEVSSRKVVQEANAALVANVLDRAPEAKVSDESEDGFGSVGDEEVVAVPKAPWGWSTWTRKGGVQYALKKAVERDAWSLYYLRSVDGRNHTARELSAALKVLDAKTLTIDNPDLAMVQEILVKNERLKLGMNPDDVKAAWKKLGNLARCSTSILDQDLVDMRNAFDAAISERFNRGALLREHVSRVQRVSARLLRDLNHDQGNGSDDENYYGDKSGPKKWNFGEVFDQLRVKEPKKDMVLGVAISLEQLNESVAEKLK